MNDDAGTIPAEEKVIVDEPKKTSMVATEIGVVTVDNIFSIVLDDLDIHINYGNDSSQTSTVVLHAEDRQQRTSAYGLICKMLSAPEQ